MGAEKCLLLVAEPSSPLTTVSKQLIAEGSRVSLVSTPDDAVHFIRTRAKLSAVIVDDTAPRVDGETLSALKAASPDLPVLWVFDPDQDEPDFGMMEPPQLLPLSLTADALTEALATVIPEDLYPGSLTLTLVSAANAVMATTFQASVDVGNPWFKLNSMLPRGYTALLPFLGDNAAGHVLVGGSVEHLTALAVDLGFDESEGTGTLVREVLGEIANQVVGRVKQDCGTYLTDLRVGLPLIFSGEGLSVSYPSGKPSLCVEVSDGRGTLHVEFSFQRANVKVDDSVMHATGDVLLF